MQVKAMDNYPAVLLIRWTIVCNPFTTAIPILRSYRKMVGELAFIWGKSEREAARLKDLKECQVASFHGLDSLIIQRLMSINLGREKEQSQYILIFGIWILNRS